MAIMAVIIKKDTTRPLLPARKVLSGWRPTGHHLEM